MANLKTCVQSSPYVDSTPQWGGVYYNRALLQMVASLETLDEHGIATCNQCRPKTKSACSSRASPWARPRRRIRSGRDRCRARR